MKQRFLTIGAIAVIAIVGLFVFEHATSAQRPDRNAQGQRGNRQGGQRGGGGMAGMMNPASLVDNSWIDLTFALKVDDETLIKARPIYQATRDKFEAKMTELRASGDWQAMRSEIQKLVTTVGPEFQASLKEVLTAEQMKKLNELTKKRQTEMQQRMNRARGGDRRGGGGGGTR